jgi:hypothetical protein
MKTVADDAQPVIADLAIVGANVRTMHPDQPRAEAIAVREGRIITVGSDQAIRKHIDSTTHVIDANSRLVLPGFNDAHVHFRSGGEQLSSVDLRDAASVQEFRDRIARFAERQPKGDWITGGDWDHENWPGGDLPTRGDIDSVTAEHPVFVNRLDGHMALANSLALEMGGVSAETPDPPGGLIVRDEQGHPTGVLKDAAMALVVAKIPSPTMTQRLDSIRAASSHAASVGVTSVQDMSGSDDVPAYLELLRRKELKTRIYVAAPLPQWQRSSAEGLKAAVGTAWLRQGALKGFADGSLGSTTALFFEPYLDAPETRGLPSDEMAVAGIMAERVSGADRAGLQVMIHAIGDRANDQILTIYESVVKEHEVRDRRFRIEHAQHLRQTDLHRFAKGNVIASMQPLHCADDGRWAGKRIRPEQLRGTYAFRSLLDQGAVLAFGSDWNVAPLDPIQGIAAAVTRRTLDGKHPNGWLPEQKITVEEAVRAYTVGSAFAEFQEHEKGQIALGMLADMVILDHDIFSIPAEQITDTHVDITIVDGKEVYRRLE